MENKTVATKEEALGYIVDAMKQISKSMEEPPEKVEDDLTNSETILRLAQAYAIVENAGRDDTGKRLEKLEKQVKDLAKYCR